MMRKGAMRERTMAVVGAALIAMGAVACQQATPATTPAPVARTPWGDPDLNGVWPDIDMVRVPVQRAPQYGTRLFMNADEHAALEKREQEQKIGRAHV